MTLVVDASVDQMVSRRRCPTGDQRRAAAFEDERNRVSLPGRPALVPASANQAPTNETGQGRSTAMPELREIATDLLFPEGPIAMPDGSVLVVEIARRCLTRVLPDGRKEIVATPGGGPNGAALGPDGKCYICNNGGFEFV